MDIWARFENSLVPLNIESLIPLHPRVTQTLKLSPPKPHLGKCITLIIDKWYVEVMEVYPLWLMVI